jgi:HAD superfamily hydrolase (TIGR01509 family)
LLLDFDGTLADSLPALRRVYERFVIGLGGEPSSDEFDALNGPRLREVVERICVAHEGRPHSAEDLTRYACLIEEELARVEPARDADTLLSAARARGIRCAIVTSSSASLVESWLDAAHLHVDLLISGDDLAEGKPSPAPYQLALRQLGVAAEEALAIEDSVLGVQSATAAGIPTLRLSSAPGAGPEKACIATLADALPYLRAV